MSPEDRLAFARRSRRDPYWWAKKVLGVELWGMQRKMIEAVRDSVRVAVKACHAPGKSFTAAVTALWFLFSFPGSIVVTTAPTWNQVTQVLWREIRQLHYSAPIDLGGDFTRSPPQLSLGEKWYAIGLSPNVPEAMAGFHAPRMLIICDEASGIPKPIYEGIRGLMASGDARILLLGNPTRPEGELYDAFHKNREMFSPAQQGCLLTISAWDTPNLAPLAHLRDAPREERLAGLRAAPILHRPTTSPKWVADQEQEFGLDSAFYKVRVLGEFPPDAPDQLIPLHLVDDAVTRWTERCVSDTGGWTDEAWWQNLERWPDPIEAGLDPARFGDSEAVFTPRSLDIVAPCHVWMGLDTVDLAAVVAEQARIHRCSVVRVDECGLGGGPYDNLTRYDGFVSEPVNVGVPAYNTERFANLKAEAYWGLRERYYEGRICHPRDERLSGQLTSIRYRYRASGQTIIEPKEDAKKRGVPSPDRAESLMLAFIRSVTMKPTMFTVGRTTDWSRMHG
ncbi:MAG: hypothetical protein AB7S38_28945 [Vulcanimicrobiota bacterium]